MLGYMPRRDDLKLPERHLGLIPTIEGVVAEEWLERLIDQVEETLDIDSLVEIAKTTSAASSVPELFPDEPLPRRASIAVAMDRAFNFYYQDPLDLLEAWGAEIKTFSLLEDEKLPDGIGGVYIGGGFPELYAAELARNDSMKRSITQAHRDSVPIYAECGGLMYLGRHLTDLEGVQHDMAGLIPLASSMSNGRLSLGYREIEALVDGPLMTKGQRTRGHEFHWSVPTESPRPERAAHQVSSQNGRPEGIRHGSIWASCIHIHLGSDPSLARRFIDVCSQLGSTQMTGDR